MTKKTSFYLEIIKKYNGIELLLAEGEKPELWRGDKWNTLALPEITKDDIIKLLSELHPNHNFGLFEESVTFRHFAEGIGSYMLYCGKNQKGKINLKFTLTALEKSDEPKINEILRYAYQRGASDVHFYSNSAPVWRIDGVLENIDGFSELSKVDLKELLYEILPERNKREFESIQDTDFGYEIPNLSRFRINYFYDRFGIGGVFRIIPEKIIPLETLGLPEEVIELCMEEKGFVIITGPTGRGKSTTQASMIDFINKRRKDHIVTIEDPIEYVHSNTLSKINQREVGSHTSSFSRALRAALREDPNVILIGEMRDLETIKIALETAETGHLVFGTLHTISAISSIDRIIDQFPSHQQNQIRTMLADCLKVVIAQTLVRKKDGGRVAAFEIMINNHAVANLIRESKSSQIVTIMQTSKQLGMRTFNDSLFELVSKGVVTANEAYTKSLAKDALRKMFEENNIRLRLEEV